MATVSIHPRKMFGKTEFVIHEKLHADVTARLAFALVEKWGMVAAVEDGEDSAGRQKLRLSTPEELVDRAYTVAKLMVKRGLDEDVIIVAPDFPPEAADDKED